MRKVVYGGACSLDGFMAGPNGEMDWLHFSKDVQKEMARTWASSRHAALRAQDLGRGGRPGRRLERRPASKGYVFSRTLTASPSPASS